MAKTAKEKLHAKKEPKYVVMEKAFASIKVGETMFVATPLMVDTYIREIPSGETQTIPELREELAKRNNCDGTCPLSTSIFVRMSAEAALEDLDAGTDVADITPFWRVVGPDDKIARKLSIDSGWISQQRELEA